MKTLKNEMSCYYTKFCMLLTYIVIYKKWFLLGFQVQYALRHISAVHVFIVNKFKRILMHHGATLF